MASNNQKNKVVPMVKAWRAKPTKRILLNRETGLYLAQSGQWSPEETDAKDFPSVFQALEFCCQYQISDAHLIFKFNTGQVDIPLCEPSYQEPADANLDPDLVTT